MVAKSRDDNDVRRVFLALWPDEGMRSALHHLADTMDVGGRCVPRDHLHLTLAFPGTIETTQAACLAERLSSLRFDPIPILLDRLGYFPRAKVAWAGPSQPPEALGQLAERARGLCLACGVQMDSRPFQPHVTLRRFARPSLRTVLDEPLHWLADTLVLVESGRHGHPGSYRLLARWPSD